jgi:3-isopropylmalate/(R)-2-methylmalate dehydratase small subunit
LFAQVAGFVGFELTIDLSAQVVLAPDGESYPFEVQAFKKHCLINGLDDIGLTLTHSQKIRDYESHRLTTKPWLAHTLAT